MNRRPKPRNQVEPKILFECNEYIIINKPALFDCQNSKDSRYSLVDWLENRYDYAGLVHRLDFGTSGTMVCAKSSQAAKKITEELASDSSTKIYHAIAMGAIEQDQLTLNAEIDSKPAVTLVSVIKRFANATLIEAIILTGRKHQIRIHLFGAGHPLLGDHLYKSKGSHRLFHRPALHAYKLKIFSKIYTSEYPEDFSHLLKELPV